MKIALLSAGPSLRQTFNPDAKFDLRVGVNRAAGAFHCDWWSCGDGQTFREHEPVGLPVLFTITEADGNLRADSRTRERVQLHRMVTWGSVGKELVGRGLPTCWTNWSITAGLVLAVNLGGREVEVFGNDMRGTVDVSGRRLDKRAELWPRVMKDWQEVVRWAKAQGVRVTQHQGETACVPQRS